MTDWLDLSVAEKDAIVRAGMSEGELAYIEGHSVDDCPYSKYSQESNWWKRGFMNARLGYQINKGQ